ncbi:la-related protein 1C [Nicotiana tabacum]|uniref:La-related protein 1C n=2 Tax=Nicotiana TaxID=4085 RepID=A0A1S4BJ74_TOBAC|nr:PREDICTED: la-related protein 1C-like [Nicotiana sylvestris]XP_016488940.1 PREDICTED: la-related protein 1C-like [Nicotiana tabacum]
MAMPADSSVSNNSPLSPVTTADGSSAAVNSPQSRLSLTSPWAQVVRGGSDAEVTTVTAPRSPSASPSPPEQVSVPDSSAQKISPENEVSDSQPESSSGTNDALGPPKKPAWNKPLNGVVEAGSVMGGAVAWPALSESTRAIPKSSSESSKPVADGSNTLPQGPVISPLPQKQANSNANSHSNANHTMPVRQRSMKHRGGSSSSVGSGPGSGSNQGGFSRAPPPPPPPLPPPFPVMPYGNLLPPVLDPRVRGPRPIGGVSSQPHGGDQSSHRNPNRKGNFGGRPRGDGSYHSRRDQDRRDVHQAPQFVPPPVGFITPQSPGSAPFMPAPLRPFAGPVGYDMPPQFIYVPTMPPESFRGVPIIPPPPPPPPPFFFPVVDPNLPALLVKQIEYYFSDDNLVKDDFLRSKMDEEGWVPIELIANFPRVRHLTNNIQFILDCLRASTLVEVQDDKVRRRDDWKKWIHTSGHLTADSGSQTPGGSTENALTSSFQEVSLGESGNDKSNDVDRRDVQVEVAVSGLSEELTSQSKLVQEGNAEEICSGHAGSSQVG